MTAAHNQTGRTSHRLLQYAISLNILMKCLNIDSEIQQKQKHGLIYTSKSKPFNFTSSQSNKVPPCSTMHSLLYQQNDTISIVLSQFYSFWCASSFRESIPYERFCFFSCQKRKLFITIQNSSLD